MGAVLPVCSEGEAAENQAAGKGRYSPPTSTAKLQLKYRPAWKLAERKSYNLRTKEKSTLGLVGGAET